MKQNSKQITSESTDKKQKSFNLHYCEQLLAKQSWQQLYNKAKNDLTEAQLKKVVKMIIVSIKKKKQQSKKFVANVEKQLNQGATHEIVREKKVVNCIGQKEPLSSLQANMKKIQQMPTGQSEQYSELKSLKQVQQKVTKLVDQMLKIQVKGLNINLKNLTIDNFDNEIPKIILEAQQKFKKNLDNQKRLNQKMIDKQQAQKKDLSYESSDKIINTPSKSVKQEQREENILDALQDNKMINQSANDVTKINITNLIPLLRQQIQELTDYNTQLVRQNTALSKEIQKLKGENQSFRAQKQLQRQKNSFMQNLKTIKAEYTIGLKQRVQITTLLQKSYGKQVQATHHIYQFKPEFKNNDLKLNNPHMYIDGRRNLLFVFRLSTDRIIGGFIPSPIQKGGYSGQKEQKEAFLFNASTGRKFSLKPQKRQRSYIYQLSFIILGSNDIRVAVHQTKIQSFLGKGVSSFQSGELGRQQLITQEELKNPLKQYNVYQIQFRGEQLNNKPGQASFQNQFLSICRSLLFSQQKANFLNNFSQNYVDINQLKEMSSQQKIIAKQKIKDLSSNKSLEERNYFTSKVYEAKMERMEKMEKNLNRPQGQISKITIKYPINKFYSLSFIKNIDFSIQPQQPLESASSKIQVLGQIALKQMQKKQGQNPPVQMKHQSIIVDFMEQQEEKSLKLEEQIQKVKTLTNQISNLEKKNLNLIQQIQKSKQSLKMQVRSYDRYFSSSSLFYNKYQKQKKYIVDVLENCYRSFLSYTKLIYRYDLINKVNFHQYIDNVAQLLVIVKTRSGKLIGGYTHQGFRMNEFSYKGFIFSATDEMDFQPNPKSKKLVTTYDPYYIIFGNSQLRIKTQDKLVFSNFGIVNNYFLTNGQNVDILIGEGKNVRETQIETFEIYQVIFSQVVS